MERDIEFVNKSQIELHEVPRGKAINRRPFGGLLKPDQPTEENASNERKALNVSLGRKHDVGLNEKLLDKIIPNDRVNCNNWLGNGNSGMNAVAQANAYTQLRNSHPKQFEKRAWKFEHSSHLLDEMDEGDPLNQDGILEAKNSTDEFAGEISLMETPMGSSKARTTTGCKIGPCIGPAVSWEEMMLQLQFFGKCN